MLNFFKKILFRIYIFFHSVMINLSIALYNTEIDILKANPDDLNEKDKKTTRKLHHNPLIEKFYAGQRDEKYVQDYYELLKKADKFMRNATPHQKAVAADKNAMNVGQKDRFGRRYDHVGFFDENHKHAGKTIGEVLDLEMKERRTTDDDYELLQIFSNKPIEVGLTKIEDVVDDEFKVNDLIAKSKTYEFPMKVVREGEALNKIEQLSEVVHVKKIGFEHRQLEFFIPKKFGVGAIVTDDKIFQEIINVNFVYFNNDYGELIGYRIIDFIKRLSLEEYEVLKFHAFEMETITRY